MANDIETQIELRAAETGLPPAVLRAVYLRECASGGAQVTTRAITRVDEFICYALTRDTHYSRDRDLAPAALLRTY